MRMKKQIASLMVGGALIAGCDVDIEGALSGLAEDIIENLATPEAAAEYSGLIAAVVDDSVNFFEIGMAVDPNQVIPQGELSLNPPEAPEGAAAPEFDILAGVETLATCKLIDAYKPGADGKPDYSQKDGIPDTPTLPDDAGTQRWCNAPDGSGNQFTLYHDVVSGVVAWAPLPWAASGERKDRYNYNSTFGVHVTPDTGIPALEGLFEHGIARVIVGAVNSSVARDDVVYTLTANAISHPTFDDTISAEQQDVFNNPAIAVKTLNYEKNEAHPLKNLVETFEAHMHGTPDDQPERAGVNGVKDETDDIWFYSALATFKNGKVRYLGAEAAEGKTFYRVTNETVPGVYSTVVTPVAGGKVTKIERVATLNAAPVEGVILSATEKFALQGGGERTSDLKIRADGSDLIVRTPLVERTLKVTQSDTGATVERTTKPNGESEISEIKLSGSLTYPQSEEEGGTTGEFTRTITLTDGDVVEETLKYEDTGAESSKITSERGEVLTITDYKANEDGSHTFTITRTEGVATMTLVATLDDDGEGVIQVSVDNDPSLEGPELSGTLVRAADGSVSGKLKAFDDAGELEFDVSEDADLDAFVDHEDHDHSDEEGHEEGEEHAHDE